MLHNYGMYNPNSTKCSNFLGIHQQIQKQKQIEKEKEKKEITELSINERRFNPYVDNGGTVIGLAGKSYVIMVGDTRLSYGYSIYTRNCSKIIKLTDKCILGSSGMQADIKAFHALIQRKIQMFILEHNHVPSVHVIARMLLISLYAKRFFPFYTFNLLAGIDENNEAVLYGYDAIGSHERLPHGCVGSGSALICPILDTRIEQNNQIFKKKTFSLTEDLNFLKDAITSAAERDIFTGDKAEIYVIDSLGINVSTMDLKQD